MLFFGLRPSSDWKSGIYIYMYTYMYINVNIIITMNIMNIYIDARIKNGLGK